MPWVRDKTHKQLNTKGQGKGEGQKAGQIVWNYAEETKVSHKNERGWKK